METLCPHCQHALNWLNDSRFQCPQCHHHFQQQAHCPECQQPLQTLSACGSVSYFCQRGHGLISRQLVGSDSYLLIVVDGHIPSNDLVMHRF